MLLVDTNVLVYAVSPAEANKQSRARSVLADLMTRNEAALAVQNCAEFLQAAALKPDSPLELTDALEQLRVWCRHMTASDRGDLDECLTYRLRRRTGLEALQAVHRG